MKYRQKYPSRPFETEQAVQKWGDIFVHWYNTEHLHSEIHLVTPNDRHYGQDIVKLSKRKDVYEQPQKNKPERWARQICNWS